MSTFTKSLRVLAVSSCLVAATASFAADPASGDPRADQAPSRPSAGMKMHQQMMAGQKRMQGMRLSGDPDRDYKAMMQHHHEQGVAMTQTYLESAKDPALRRWAQKMLTNQRRELQELRALGGDTAATERPKNGDEPR